MSRMGIQRAWGRCCRLHTPQALTASPPSPPQPPRGCTPIGMHRDGHRRHRPGGRRRPQGSDRSGQPLPASLRLCSPCRIARAIQPDAAHHLTQPCRPPCPVQAAAPASGARARRRHGSAAHALQAADYSFYQRLREGELTESYLWETRLLPLLGYLSADETTAVRAAAGWPCGCICRGCCWLCAVDVDLLAVC